MPPEAVTAISLADDYLEHLEAGGTHTPEEFLAAQHHGSDEALELLRLVAAFESERRRQPAVGGRLGPYRIEGVLGRGGMGVVYRATDTRLDREVALKVNLHGPLDPRTQQRFLREARAAAQLHHTNLVPVHELGSEEGIWFYAMDRVDGRPLDEVVRAMKELGEPPGAQHLACLRPQAAAGQKGAYARRVAEIFVGLAEALHRAHLAGILHRDVKPANLIVSDDGVLMLTDFGLARLQEETAALTGAGQRVGTPVYMSPEQVRGGTTPVDARSDIYSVGTTLYETLTLRRPFEGATTEAVYHLVLTSPPRPVRVLNPDVPKDLATIVHKALEKEPERRYATAADLAADLRAFLDGLPIRARPVGPVVRTWRKMQRNRALAVTIVAALVLGTLGAIWSIVSLNEARLEAEAGRQTADQRRAVAEDAIIWMLFDLSERLQDVGRSDIVLEIAAQADALYAKLSLEKRKRSVMQVRSKIFKLKGGALQKEGRREEARTAYLAGLAILEDMLQDATDPPDREWQPAIELQWLEASLQVAGVTKDLDQALAIAQKVRDKAQALIQRDPEDSDWLIARGYADRLVAMCHLRKGRRELAIEAMRRSEGSWKEMVVRDPGRAAWVLEYARLAQYRAVTHANAGEMDAAIDAWRESVVYSRKAMALEPGNFTVKKEYGLTLRDLARTLFDHRGAVDEALEITSEAVEVLGKVFSRDPTHQRAAGQGLAVAHGLRGNGYRENGEAEAAIDAYRAGLAIARTVDWGVDDRHYEIAAVLVDLERLEEARSHYERAETFKRKCNKREGKEDDHGLERAWRGLGRVHELRGDHAEARSWCKAVLARREDDVDALRGLGRVLCATGERAAGIERLRRAFAIREERLAKKPENTGRQIELADVALDLGTALLEGSEAERTEGVAVLRRGLALSRQVADHGRPTARQRIRVARYEERLQSR